MATLRRPFGTKTGDAMYCEVIPYFTAWAAATTAVYAGSRYILSGPAPHGLPHPKTRQVVALVWTAMASVLFVVIGWLVVLYRVIFHGL